MGLKHATAKSFSYAGEGVKTAIKQEPNFRVHIVVAITAIVLAFILNFTTSEWAILLLTISIVVILELINTAVESIVDIVSPEIKDEAKIAKDVSAASVLIAAAMSIMIGLILYLPKLIALL